MVQYVLVGHITADVVGHERRLGGTVAYAAPVARAFGLEVALLTSAAKSEILLAELTPIVDMVHVPAKHTTTFENQYYEQKRYQYVHAVAASLQINHVPHHWLQAPLVHFAPLVNEVDLTMLDQFNGATTMLTLQGCLRHWDDRGRVQFKAWYDEAILRSVDIVVLSRQDIEPYPTLEAAYAAVTKHLIVTDGVRGGIYYQQGKPKPYTALPTEEVDPTGAGDVFAATVLASLPQVGYRVERAIKMAAFVAAASVCQKGACMQYGTQLIQQASAYAHKVENIS